MTDFPDQLGESRLDIARREGNVIAVVHGKTLRELPSDLYIPPQALEVFLEAFEGPLDLLLYLIRRQNLDILDIRVAEITEQYMRYIELMKALKLDLAGEYLLIAAMLAEIKSRLLLPRPTAEEDEEGPLGPSWYAACRSTSASSKPPSRSTSWRGWSAICTKPAPRRRRLRSVRHGPL